MKVVFFRNKCIGCGSCVQVLPKRWQISRLDGKSNLIGASSKNSAFVLDTTELERAGFEECMINCPVNIIRIEG